MYLTIFTDHYKVLCGVYLVWLWPHLFVYQRFRLSTFEWFHTDLETVFRIYKPGFFWPRLYLQCCNHNRLLWSFRELCLFWYVFVSYDVCISNFLYDWLGVSCIAPKLIGPECFVYSGGTYFVPAKAVAARMPIHGSASSTYVSCRLYERTRFPSNWCIISMVAFASGLPEGAGFFLTPYYCFIKILLNSRLSNYPPW